MLWFVKYLAVFLFFGNLVDAGIIDDINFVFYGQDCCEHIDDSNNNDD